MTKMLEQAFQRASRLSQREQDALAAWLLEELEAERRWDDAFARSQAQLKELGDQAQQQHARGETEPLDLDKL